MRRDEKFLLTIALIAAAATIGWFFYSNGFDLPVIGLLALIFFAIVAIMIWLSGSPVEAEPSKHAQRRIYLDEPDPFAPPPPSVVTTTTSGVSAAPVSSMAPVVDDDMFSPAVLQQNSRRPDGSDDLELIEGIGPKYDAALVNYGIDNFAKLAKATETELHAAAKAAGMNRSGSMISWAQQAQLAANRDWEALSELKRQLYYGQ